MPFAEIVGHRPLRSLLSRSIERDTLPPSLMFAGPAGVGKRLMAVAVAQAFNCTNPKRTTDAARDGVTFDACGACAACARIARGVHPDVPIVEPGDSGAIKIEAIRDVVDRAAYRPFEGRRRVVIIDEADAALPAAQNAMLKTLEEPPSASTFILVTSRPDALLPTVRSRCPRLRFRPLGLDDVTEVLVRQGRAPAEARAIAAIADGSVGQAFAADGRELIEARDIALRVLAGSSASSDPRRRIEQAKDLLAKTGAGGASDREQLATHLRAMSSLLRDIALLAAGADRSALANAGVEDRLTRLLEFRGDRGAQAFAVVDRALAALERNAGVKVVADWVAVSI